MKAFLQHLIKALGQRFYILTLRGRLDTMNILNVIEQLKLYEERKYHI